jgi:DNA-binding NarL/FixJ family response regulator
MTTFENQNTNIKVVIFEDNRHLRDGLRILIRGSVGFECAGAFPNCDNLLVNIEDAKPDVVLMDIEMPGMSGIEAVKLLKTNFPGIKVLMETIFEDDEKVFKSICNGAEGYILKSTPPTEILLAIKEIYEGGAPMTPGIASKVLTMFRKNSSIQVSESFDLTQRENEILKYLVEGMSYKVIAENCFISPETVRGHIKNIYKKLHVHSKSEAVVRAIRGKIV